MSGARNSAVALASGAYLSFLDADDRFRPDKIAHQTAILDADPSVDVVFGHMTEFVSPDVDDQAARRSFESPFTTCRGELPT